MAADDKTTKKKTSAKTAVKKSATKKDTPSKKATSKIVSDKKVTIKKSSTKKSVATKTDVKSKTKKPENPENNKKTSGTKTANKNTTDSKVTNQPITHESKASQIVEQEQLMTTPTNNNNLVRGKFKPYNPTPDEEYMNASQRDHFKAILKDWKTELMDEVDRTVHHMKDESANLPDPADRATQEEEFSLELRTRDRERKLIKKIDKTLGRLEHDDYGFCDGCGVEIGLRRLEARPTASLCIDCKTLDEIKERQYRM